MKGFLWPDEVVEFVKLFCRKHPEIPIGTFINDYGILQSFGCYYRRVNKYGHELGELFGDNGILFGPPLTPKKHHDKKFVQLAIKRILKGDI